RRALLVRRWCRVSGLRTGAGGCLFSAASAGLHLLSSGGSGTGLLLGFRLLASCGPALCVACRLLGSSSVSRRLLGRSALLSRYVLPRILAPLKRPPRPGRFAYPMKYEDASGPTSGSAAGSFGGGPAAARSSSQTRRVGSRPLALP